MLTVQNDWIEYVTEPVQARRVAVRGGAACAQRSAQPGLLGPSVLGAPAARPVRAQPRVVVAPARAAAPARHAARPAPSRQAPARRLRLTRRGRVVLVLLPSLLVLSGLLLATAPGVAEAAQPARDRAAATFVVGTGDTLWTIAERIAPGTDPRVTVAAIQRANHLDSSAIAAGDVLVVPAGR